MAFGRRGLDPEGSRRAEASLGSLEAGGLPLAAQERLANLSAGGGAFTSDLSTAEFLLLRQAGFRPLAQVMGSCFYRIGWQYMPGERAPGSYVPEGQMTPTGAYEYDSLGRRVYSGASFGQVFELDVETQAWQEARRLALGRLGQEATLVGADAVVGVKLRRGSYDWGRNMIEFNLVGMGVLPLEFAPGEDFKSLGLTGLEIFDFEGLGQNFEPKKKIKVRARDAQGQEKQFTAVARVDTPFEVAYYQHGGILQYVLRQML